MNPFGANWKTSASGYLETICAVVIALCAIPSEIWMNPRVWIPTVLLIIAKTVKDTLTKDKNVTGGNTMQTMSGAVVRDGAQTMVDQTVIASVKSGENIPLDVQRKANS